MSKIREIYFEQLQETLYYEQLENGLDVYVLPKPGFQKTYATFTTKYGSIDNHFITPNGAAVKVPDGIAHFLEHKMFEEEDGDIFHQFSKQGASANAYTTFDRTAYLFSSTDHVEENLTTLIDFVQRPYFTDQNVEKEKGIIEQEIRMYQDDPDWRVFFGFLEALYHQHPVKIDIAGTVESIYKINKELLYTCYETFYHPSNMLLFVVGAVEPEAILDLVRQNQQAKSFEPKGEIKRIFEKEPETVVTSFQEIRLGVEIPKCLVGFKEHKLGLEGEAMLKQELATVLLLDMAVGPSSNFYQELMDAGLIDDSFGVDYNLEKDYGFSVMGGNTREPEKLAELIREHLANIAQHLNQDDFERSRKKRIGSFLRSFNSPEFIANQFTRYQFNRMNLFDVIPMLEQITFHELVERAKEHFNLDRFAVCLVR